MRAALNWIRCRFGRHAWTVSTVSAGGVGVAVRHCGRCRRVDVESIETVVWNRAARRRQRQQLQRRTRRRVRKAAAVLRMVGERGPQ